MVNPTVKQFLKISMYHHFSWLKNSAANNWADTAVKNFIFAQQSQIVPRRLHH